MSDNNEYQLNETVNFKYLNPPVQLSDRHKIGQIIDISEGDDTLAFFRVVETDSTDIKGIIVEICGGDS